MSISIFLSTTLLCALLAGCLTVPDATRVNRPHDTASPNVASPAVVIERRPVVSVPPAKAVANTDEINFRIIDARAKIGNRDYVFDVRNRPAITALGGDVYQLDLTLRRDSNSSLRGDETFTTHFYYDGLELIFFGDKNRNQHFDRHESGVRHIISHTQEFIAQGNKRYVQPRTLNVTLRNEHIRSSLRIQALNIRLLFQAER